MNQFLERLPWQIAAFAGLTVGGISWAAGSDGWHCLLRVGLAFALFAALGLALRAVLLAPARAAAPDTKKGRHLDTSTPEMTVDDLQQKQTPPSETSAPAGDESRR